MKIITDFPNRPEFKHVAEEMSVCQTIEDVINFAFYCLNRADTSLGEYSKAYKLVATNIFFLYTGLNYNDDYGFEKYQKK